MYHYLGKMNCRQLICVTNNFSKWYNDYRSKLTNSTCRTRICCWTCTCCWCSLMKYDKKNTVFIKLNKSYTNASILTCWRTDCWTEIIFTGKIDSPELTILAVSTIITCCAVTRLRSNTCGSVYTRRRTDSYRKR